MNRTKARTSTKTRTTRQPAAVKARSSTSHSSLSSIASVSALSHFSTSSHASSSMSTRSMTTSGSKTRNHESAVVSRRGFNASGPSSSVDAALFSSPSRSFQTRARPQSLPQSISAPSVAAMPTAQKPQQVAFKAPSTPAWTPSFAAPAQPSRRFFSSDREKQKAEDAAADAKEGGETSGSESDGNDIKALHSKYAAVKKELEEYKALNTAQEAALKDWQSKAKELQLRVKSELEEQELIHERYKRELNDVRKFGISKFCKNLLEGVDTLEMALKAANLKLETVDNPELANFREGVTMTHEMFQKILGEQGVVKYESMGTIADPNLHFIAAQLPQPDTEPGTITHVIKEGYMIQDRVLRPAQVCVVAPRD